MTLFIQLGIIGRVQVSQEGLKLNGTYPSLGYAADVNILGESGHKNN